MSAATTSARVTPASVPAADAVVTRAALNSPVLVPPTLPTGTARLAAAAAATAMATLSAWITGVNNISWKAAAGITCSSLLLLMAIALGVRARAIFNLGMSASIGLGIAVAVTGGSISASWILTYALVPPSVVCLVFLLLLWVVPGAESVRSGLLIGLITALVATAWPIPGILGTSSLVASGYPFSLVVAEGALFGTWLATDLGRTVSVSAGAALAKLRDAAVRVLTVTAGLGAALWTGAAIDHLVSSLTIDTPLESLTPTAGWIVAIGPLAVIGWIGWQLPRWLLVTQLRGRFDALSVCESRLFVISASLAALVVWRIFPMTSPGRACWIALAASAGYVCCRLWYASPIDAPNAPLWLVLIGEKLTKLDRGMARIASRWYAGQVTILAPRNAPKRIRGEHLRAAIAAGRGSALFPTRPVHLEDWADAQPESWRALPVRELYAPAELWPKILGERVEKSARVLVLTRGLSSIRSVSGSDVTITRTTIGFLVPRSDAPQLRPDMSSQEVMRLATETVQDSKLVARLRELAPKPEPIVTRQVMLLATPMDIALAERVARRVHGTHDSAGRIIESWVAVADTLNGAPLRLYPLQLGLWQHAALPMVRLLESANTERPLRRALIRMARFVLGPDQAVEFELVVVESPRGVPVTGIPPSLIENAVQHHVLARLLAIRTAVAASEGALTYPASWYAGEIRLPGTASIDLASELVANKLLALDLQPLSIAQSMEAQSAASAAAVGTMARVQSAPESVPSEPPATDE